ncbi:MAG TPA: ParA family protein [Myxococcota bacterium]|nr:ParA family protein [Myxococcota bacterium]HNZ03384.1 ParA family protein [Myxococcota bacterium]HPB50464.1 ParA family protein [Myxococcota bacterium]HQP95410.1 ParA family protein [Myxococcota bacterium]
MSLAEQIRKIVGMEDEPLPGSGRARVLAVAARKGGVGKTTTATCLAVALARFHGLKVLLVDMDGQGHVQEALSSIIPGIGGAALSDILLGSGRDTRYGRDLMDIVVATSQEGLHVTPSDKGLAAAEGVISGRIGREFLLRTAIRPAMSEFDVIVLDCPPNVGNLTLNVLTAATHVLIPCDMSVLSLAAVSDIVGVIDTVNEQLRHDLKVVGILPTRVDRRNGRLTDEVLRQLHHTWGSQVCRTSIPGNSALARAQMNGQSIFDFEPASTGAQAYRKLAREVIARTGISVAGDPDRV